MGKLAVVLLADVGTPGSLRRLASALKIVRDAKTARDDVELVFDGAGTQWVRELIRPDHRLRALFEAVRDRVTAVCDTCAATYGVQHAARAAGLPLTSDTEGHPSLQRRIACGYSIVTL